MKLFLMLSFLLLFTACRAHQQDFNSQVTQQQQFIKNSGFWTLSKADSSILMFCYGVDPYSGRPLCSRIPEQYIVIELPRNLQ